MKIVKKFFLTGLLCLLAVCVFAQTQDSISVKQGETLTADTVTHQLFEYFCRTCNVAVPKLILCIALHLLRNIAALAVMDALADCNQNTVLLFQFFLHIL